MSILFYKVLHIVSLMMVFLSLGAVLSHMLQGGEKQNFKNRKLMAILHGIATLVAFVSGFGLMAKSGYTFSNSPWLFIKIIAWIFIGGFPTLTYKKILPPWLALFTLTMILIITVVTVVYRPV